MTGLLVDIDWRTVTHHLVLHGWSRIEAAVDPAFAAALEHEAPGAWTSLPATEGSAGVRQAGLSCHSEVAEEIAMVGGFARAIREGIDSGAMPGLPPLPRFNHAEWCRAEGGEKFITPHRDPPMAGGIIAVLTTQGRAPFRVWETDGSSADAARQPERAEEWETNDGDLVLLRGGGWPTSTSRCPIHEVHSPTRGDRVTLTLRHNKGGYGADYFS